MPKKIALVFAIIFAAFVLQGCYSSSPSSPQKPNAFPAGHDMHPDTQKIPDEENTHPLKEYS